MIIIDASVAVKWVVGEPSHEMALSALELDENFVAPDLMLAEFANVLRKKLRAGQIVTRQIIPALELVCSAVAEFIPSEKLVKDALPLAAKLDHSVYDCMYLACAVDRGRLLTADERFIQKCRLQGFGPVVMALSDLSNVPSEPTPGTISQTDES